MTFCAALATFSLPTPKYRVIRGIKGGITKGKNDERDSFSFSHTNLVIAGGITGGIKMSKKGRCKCLAFGHGIKGGIKMRKKRGCGNEITTFRALQIDTAFDTAILFTIETDEGHINTVLGLSLIYRTLTDH